MIARTDAWSRKCTAAVLHRRRRRSDTRTRTHKKNIQLALVHEETNGRLLLGMKKRGFGAGYYNGFGGKVEAGETIAQAAAREVRACRVRARVW